MVEKHWSYTDAEFEQLFKSCELPPVEFSHEAHLRLAWLHISQYGIVHAEENIQNQLQKFVAFVGAKDKYHTTLTIAAIRAVYHFMLKSKSDNFEDFIVEFPQLKHKFKTLMGAHYSFDIFSSAKAKVEFLQPDLNPFD